MKRTTLVLEDGLMGEIKREAAKNHSDMSGLVNELLREGLSRRKKPRRLPLDLPSFSMGHTTLPFADRDALEEAMGDA
ncbi:MAG: hypothetical protein SFU85_03615 [Candidatus Methylacidiphilales bacterium]|nr:hypothetical protein [Candidatus Methylacidiphilales bacterium]